LKRSLKNSHRSHRRYLVCCLAMMVLGFGVFSAPSTSGSSKVGGDHWYKVTLEEGETQGFSWVVGAKGRTHEPLREICALAAIIAPPEPNVPYGEGSNVSVCGSAMKPAESVSANAKLGSTGTSLLTTIYRPVVRKVVFLLSTGKRKVFRPKKPRLANREERGIPAFRYLVASFDGGACVRSVTTFDGRGRVISKEGEPCAGRLGGSSARLH
jgi:hypothetical protein